MWKRIEYAEWVDMVPIIAFILTFSVFVLLVTRTILMKKTQVKKLASLPLEEGSVGVPPSSTTPVPPQP
jgi:hypothetical protein